MALITDLPAASGLSNTDLLVIDTGSQTQKIQAQNAGASESNAGLMTTGNQTFSGDKTFSPNLNIQAKTTSNPSLFYWSEGTPQRRAYLQYNKASRVMRFVVYSQNSSTEVPISNYEVYDLPAIDQDRTGNASYNILTTKNFTTTLWFESAGSQTYSLTNYHHYLVTISRYVAGSSADNLGLYIVGARVNVPTNSAAVRTIISSNLATVSASGGSLTITASATYIKATIIDLL